MDKLITSLAEHWIDENGIYHKKVFPNVHANIDLIEGANKKVSEFAGNKKRLILYHADVHFTMTEDVMEYLRNKVFTERSIAVAVVSNKIGVKLIMDYIKNIKKLKTPLKAFSTEKEAVKWLLTFKNKL